MCLHPKITRPEPELLVLNPTIEFSKGKDWGWISAKSGVAGTGSSGVGTRSSGALDLAVSVLDQAVVVFDPATRNQTYF